MIAFMQSTRIRMELVFAVMALLLAVLAPRVCQSAEAEKSGQGNVVSTHSIVGSTFKTIVDRKTEGTLSAEDFRQVSTLASQMLTHIGVAAERISDKKPDEVKKELQLAKTLAGVIRKLLPATTITTKVEDKDGKEIYHYEEGAQDDLLPLYSGMVSVDVLQAVTDKKQEEAALKGIRLADAEVLYTSALFDLNYVERKIDLTLTLMGNDDKDALAQLLLAQSHGVRYSIDKEDNPLVKAQAAVRLAERMVQEGKHEAADENLRLARLHLDTYRSVIGKDEDAKVRELQSQILKLTGKTKEAGSTATIRTFWDQISSWFKTMPGQAHETKTASDTTKEKPETMAGTK